MPARALPDTPASALATGPRAIMTAPIPMRLQEDATRIVAVGLGANPRTPAMPQQIKSLADALRTAQTSLPRAMAAAEKLVSNVNDLTDATVQVEALSTEIQKHTAGVRALLGGLTNGGPALDADEKAGGA